MRETPKLLGLVSVVAICCKRADGLRAVDAVAQPHEDPVRTGCGVVERVLEAGRKELVGEERAGPHLQMLGSSRAHRRHRGRPDDAKVRWRCYPIVHLDHVTDVLVQLCERDGPEHDLVRSLEPATGEHGWTDGRVRTLGQHRYGLSVELHGGEVHRRPRGDVGIVVEKVGGLLLGHVAAVRAGAQFVVPVPAVQRGVRHEPVEAGPEREASGDHDDRERGADDRGSNGHRGASGSGLEREADAGHGWQQQPGGDRSGRRSIPVL